MESHGFIVRIREPREKSERPPLLLVLHGYGASEVDLLPIMEASDPRYLAVALRAPHALPSGGFAWFSLSSSEGRIVSDEDEAMKSVESLASFIASFSKERGVDPERIHMLGFSQGAMMSLATALSEYPRVSAIALLSGRVLAKAKERIPEGRAYPSLSAFIGHGDSDPIVPVRHGRATYELLESLRAVAEYREYPMKHEISRPEAHAALSFLAARLR